MAGGTHLNPVKQHLQTAYLLSDERVEELLPLWLNTLGTCLLHLEKVLTTGNLQELGRASHAVKETLLNLGLTDLAEQIFFIEQQSKSGNTATDYRTLITELKGRVAAIGEQ